MKKRTINQAIEEALKREGVPMRAKELFSRIVEDDLYRFRAINPEHIVRTQLRRHSINLEFPTAHKSKHFVFLKDGTYWLKGVSHPNINAKEQKKAQPKEFAKYEEIRELHKKYLINFKQTVLNQLSEIDPTEFEHFCRKLLSVYGFKNVKVTQQSKDGGIDGHGELKIGLATMQVAFECKRWSATVGRPKISQFRGDIQGRFQQGIFFTTSRFSKDAKDASFQAGAVPIILVDGNGIVELMIEKRFGVEREDLPIYTNAMDLVLQNND
ncbi:restriction endonuclease [uncultured Imperialibacter sp.]|uniref:restriction endonuclease n=1 Tax=uncultured Imperialibacter sp. TaxID=1672639 RepID=UPI0030D9F307|tara:strand:- start:15019 stop:15825 length:807 start_codon:yes stop_codon:yes gene_type:complete